LSIPMWPSPVCYSGGISIRTVRTGMLGWPSACLMSQNPSSRGHLILLNWCLPIGSGLVYCTSPKAMKNKSVHCLVLSFSTALITPEIYLNKVDFLLRNNSTRLCTHIYLH
jgi:hypothetical protein